MEDPDLIVDLCELNKGHSNKFAVFWEKMRIYLNETSAVHERRHGEITYMAKAISVRDLNAEVAKMCPGEPVPSEQWVRLCGGLNLYCGCSCVCLMIFVSCMLGFCSYPMVVTCI